MNELPAKLDLTDFLTGFQSFFAREKDLYLEGDSKQHFRYITELDSLSFPPPPSLASCDTALQHLKKLGTLKLYELFEFIKIIRYFLRMRDFQEEGLFKEWAHKINHPAMILEIESELDGDGEIKPGVIPELDSILQAIRTNREKISENLNRLLSSPKVIPYLTDRQIHYQGGEECLLVRGGFNHVLKATVIGRSGSGYFYVIPQSLATLKDKESELLSRKEELIYHYCEQRSKQLQKEFLFLRFINREFDRFDHYQARVQFAKSGNLEFLLPDKSPGMTLERFKHPALSNPKPFSIQIDKQLLLITGVNAGGKTMLLKSILSAAYLARHLIPMPINAHHSRIGSFKEINAIIDDPQNVKNDISTFAGRMSAFSELFGRNEGLIGVDEIELGTDSDEAASLFKTILQSLMQRGFTIVLTTHHKRLAALMAAHSQTELLAALYDEQTQSPTYSFLKGTIGKSYAFETAERYGIPRVLVKEARTIYGQDKEKLNELIEKSSQLERDLAEKNRALAEEVEQAKSLRISLQDDREAQELEFRQSLRVMEKEYQEAIEIAKEAAKAGETPAIHRQIAKAHQSKQQIHSELPAQETAPLKVGDRVKHHKTKGILVALSAKDATIETDEGIKLVVARSSVKKSGAPAVKIPSSKKVTLQTSRPSSAQVKLDLHGKRSEEAIEELDKFLSDSLLAGFSEVLVFHGIGTGKLAFAVKEHLKRHPRVVSFADAPPHMGGYGAKIIQL